ncbi:alpha/beta hydrolase [Phytomonospora sp. NPDC050363]|uniref:alpha/beta fold hydrolase n=1 Tax=Phytomonospora sp. NPDC050363 TaxID=3155642 RepID=UPI0033DF3552
MTAHHRTATVEGLEIFYREAGDPANPTLLLLHGFPTSSSAYKGLIDRLAGEFHLIAPDYPGFGHSEAPPAGEWDYTFDHLADVVEGLLDHLGVTRHAIYVHDYGAPVGFRLALRHPERVTGIVSQNGNAYDEGLTAFWDAFRPYWAAPDAENTAALRGLLTADATRWQYSHGVPDTSLVDPDLAAGDQALLDRPGNAEIQLALFTDYGVNPGRYPDWQRYLRDHRPPVLAVWGRGDEIFGPDGATAFTRDQPDATVRLLDTGHFPLTTHLDESAELIAGFLRGLPH